jgi:hypothetical protein
MIKYIRIKKTIAFFFLSLLTIETLFPVVAWALTSGPAQPESKQFATAGTSDLVDLFSGAFKYDVPIMDIDGYPINLNYQSGVNMEDEASWVGLGWNLNVGAINRQLRGLPDDFNGDEVTTEHTTKPKVTIGGRGTLKTEIKGLNIGKLSGSLSLGIFSDNYTGIGAEVGANAGLSFSIANSGLLTGGLGLGINSNTSSGVSVTPSVSLSLVEKINDLNTTSMTLSASLGYNTRQGLKDLSLSQSFGFTRQDDHGSGSASFETGGATFTYNTPGFYPQANISYKSTNQTYSIDVGGVAFAVFVGGGLTGYYSKREVSNPINKNPAYGFMYAEKGTGVDNAMMDFMREKDNPVIPALPNLAIPIATPDLFSYSSQAGSGQFRLYRGSTSVVFDAGAKDVSNNLTIGVDLGFGAYFHGGVTLYNQDVTTQTGKWKNENGFLPLGDYPVNQSKIEEEPVYFKRSGEKNISDENFIGQIQGEKVVSVPFSERNALAGLRTKDQLNPSSTPYKKTGRQVRRSAISWLTAEEASTAGALDKKIMNTAFQDSATFSPASCRVGGKDYLSRIDDVRKKHHLSEITVQGDDGKRMVYGLPVYNLTQEEYSFAVNPATADLSKNLVKVETSGGKVVPYAESVDKYLHHETQPAYATSYLLTGILSPDYVDLTGDGISDDDPGSAIRFNYSKVEGKYKWRAPYDSSLATYNKGLSADSKDDKGSFVYGEKELWYIQSIETKTKVLYFITEDRQDALGVRDFLGGRNTTVRQRRLKEIRLYSKSDLLHPVKTAVFQYDYSLCPGVPNHTKIDGTGKLTLKGVYFKYGNSDKGKNHPYKFDYEYNQGYGYLSSDRWGNYKPAGNNISTALRNDEFPYSIQDKAKADEHAGKWQLTKVTLPAGGEIKVDYESGDYAYVQDKKAMEMVSIKNMINARGEITNDLSEAMGFRIKTPIKLTGNEQAQTRSFVETYLNGSSTMYAKLFANVTDQGDRTDDNRFEFIPCYAKVVKAEQFDNDYADVYFEQMYSGGIGGSPFVFAVWQKMRMEYPKYAYPGYENRIDNDRPLAAALGAIVNAMGTLSELKENFYQRAKRKKFGCAVKLDKSFCRLVKTSGKKLGGSARVKYVRISDTWGTMTNNAAPQASYGQAYFYNKTEYRNGKSAEEISSGVASYEPGIGSDENPLRMPVPYTEELRGTMNNYFYLEEPFGETLYPAPQVGYSAVTIKELDGDGAVDASAKTGWRVMEYYTAKEFPVLVDYERDISPFNHTPDSWHNFMGGHVVHEFVTSQGYVVILNDMHGKEKAEHIFNQSGSEISSTVYHYNAEQIDAGKYRLRNKVNVVGEEGFIERNRIIGREVEMFVDMRQQETSNSGTSIQIGADVIPFFFGIPLPIPHWPIKQNDEYRLFRSSSVLKTIQYAGILDRVVKTINGSTVTSSNLLYDANTGEPVVTQTNNEFDDPVYTTNVPAYWIHGQMGGAYINLNTVLEDFSTSGEGVIDNKYATFLSAGDELINLSNIINPEKLWVINSETSASSTKALRVIDIKGAIRPCSGLKVKVLRSGYRNQLTSGAMSIVSLKDPVFGGSLQLVKSPNAALFNILDAKATMFDEKWGMEIPCVTCPPGYVMSADKKKCVGVVVEDLTFDFSIIKGDSIPAYGIEGASFYNADNTKITTVKNSFWGGTCSASRGVSDNTLQKKVVTDSSGIIPHTAQVTGDSSNSMARGMLAAAAPGPGCGRLVNAGIWLGGAKTTAFNDIWVGVETCVTIPAKGTYSVGFAADNQFRITVGNRYIVSNYGVDNSSPFLFWHVYPVEFYEAGTYRVKIEAKNEGAEAAVALEIYKGTPASLVSASPEYVTANTLFSTKNLRGKEVNSFYYPPGFAFVRDRYSCQSGRLDLCAIPCNCGVETAGLTNPYVKGFLGNWRPSEEKAYKEKRNDQQHLNNNAGVGVRNSGYYTSFSPFWRSTGFSWDVSMNLNWLTTRWVTLYDNQGQELENRDVIGRFSSALYGYKNLLPTAVASNAMQREVFYDGFDDYAFRNLCLTTSDGCTQDSFNIYNSIKNNYAQRITNTDAHTGNYSLKLTAPITLNTIVHEKRHKSEDYLDRSELGEYVRKPVPDLYPRGFVPNDRTSYVFSVWVKDGQAPSDAAVITLKVNNTNIELKRKATVEGWALIEGVIDLPARMIGFTNATFVISGPSNALIDDLRIFPFDAMVKTYAYDDKLLKVMAVLDENNFATFYEYDAEGTMVRVKKETERGIMTIQESRSSYQKSTN